MKLGLALGVSLLLSAPPALSADGPPFTRVALLLPACELPGMSAVELRDAVALELQAAGLTLAPRGELSPATDVLVRLDATCPQGDDLTLVAEYAEQRRRRRIALGELDRTQHARALSLSLAELLAAFSGQMEPPSSASDSAAELAASPEPVVASAAPNSEERAAKSSAAPARVDRSAQPATAAGDLPRSSARAAWQPGLASELRVFDGTWLWGGRARLRRDPWTASADLLAARSSAVAGEVTTLLAQLDAAYDARLWGSTEGLLLEAGPRVGAGVVVMHAEPKDTARGADALDAYFDAAIATRISLNLGQAVRSGLGVEVGYARGPVGRADGVEITRTAGPFASLLVDVTLH